MMVKEGSQIRRARLSDLLLWIFKNKNRKKKKVEQMKTEFSIREGNTRKGIY